MLHKHFTVVSTPYSTLLFLRSSLFLLRLTLQLYNLTLQRFTLTLVLRDLALYALDLLLDEVQPAIDGHDCFCLVLLQQHRAYQLVDVRVVFEQGKLGLDAGIFLLLRFELLTRGD